MADRYFIPGELRHFPTATRKYTCHGTWDHNNEDDVGKDEDNDEKTMTKTIKRTTVRTRKTKM